jgi:GTPase
MASLVDPNYKITKTAVAFAGSVDAGKSSLIGCLSYNILDDGRGSARTLVAKHDHEIKSGKTSDISTRIYDANSGEAITFVDLCGHEKYFKTTSFALSGYFLDYAILVVSCNRGMLPMTKQHLRLLLSYNIPFIVVITHIDQLQEDVYNKTKTDMVHILKRAGGKQTTTKFVNDALDQNRSPEDIMKIEDQAVTDILDCLLHIANGKQMIYPVLSMSNKTGAFLNVLKTVLSRITPRLFWTPGGAEMVTQNKVVKQQLNSLERQYELYKTKYVEDYRQALYKTESVHPDLESFMKGQLLIANGNVTGIDQDALTKEIDQLVEKYEAVTTERLKKLSDSLQPVFQEFTETIFYVDSSCNPPGTQLVLSGICRGKKISPGDTIYVGPIGNQFFEVKVKTIHNNVKQFVPYLEDHDRGSLSVAILKKADIQRKHIKKGTIAISSLSLLKNVCYRFKAIIKLYDVSVTMKTGTTPVIHLNTIAQPARMIVDPNENGGKKEICFDGQTTSVAVVTFKFKMKPAFIEPFNLFVLRSGDIQGVGMVVDTLSMELDTDARPDPIKPKKKTRGIRGKPKVGEKGAKQAVAVK